MSITLGNSIQIKGQYYKNSIEISTEDAIQEILDMGIQSERDRIVKMIEHKIQTHDIGCYFLNEGSYKDSHCTCGKLKIDKVLYELLSNLKKDE